MKMFLFGIASAFLLIVALAQLGMVGEVKYYMPDSTIEATLNSSENCELVDIKDVVCHGA